MAKIVGKIISERNKSINPISAEGVSYANVFTKKDNKITKYTQADEKGQFNLDVPLNEKFYIQSTGFFPAEFTATQSGTFTYYLQPSTDLDEVTITAKRTYKTLFLLLLLAGIYLFSKKRKK